VSKTLVSVDRLDDAVSVRPTEYDFDRMAQVTFASRELLGSENCRTLVEEWGRMLGAMKGTPMPAVSDDLEDE